MMHRCPRVAGCGGPRDFFSRLFHNALLHQTGPRSRSTVSDDGDIYRSRCDDAFRHTHNAAPESRKDARRRRGGGTQSETHGDERNNGRDEGRIDEIRQQ
jgi:hypothetical protein